MAHKYKRGFIIGITIICVLVAVVLFFANGIVENKIKASIKTLPKNVQLHYSDIQADVFSGGLTVKKPELEIHEGVKSRIVLHVILQDLELVNVSYWDYLVKNTIHLDELFLKDAKLSYLRIGGSETKDSKKSDSILSSPDTSKTKAKKAFDKIVQIDSFNLEHAEVTIYDKNKDSIFLKSENTNISLKSFRFDSHSAKKSNPFQYEAYHIITDSIRFNAGEFEVISLQSLELSKDKWLIKNFKVQTKYSKEELTKTIKKERDHFDVSVKTITFKSPTFGGTTQNRLFFKSEEVDIDYPDLKIFRNKLVADDHTIKPLYSRMLRELKIDLTLPKVELTNGTIVYEEKVNNNAHPGSIYFDDFNASIKNISNTYTAPAKTELEIDAIFMKAAPLHADWSFDVNDETDTFLFKTEIGGLASKRLNVFTEPNLNIKSEGQFDKIYATINGTSEYSYVNFQIKYDNMKLDILNKNHEKRKFLSSVANIFLKNDSTKHENGFVSKNGYVERDKTKSVFNFIWLNIKEGLKLVFVGKI